MIVWFKVIGMKFGSKILGLILIMSLVTAAMPTGSFAADDHSSAPSAALGQHPASCHAHGGKSLPLSSLPHSPLPASYKCCLTGHDAAAVPASISPIPQAQGSRRPPQIEYVLTGCFLGGLEVSMVRSADPPGTTPLRI